MKITKVDIYMLDATAQRASRRPICCRVWTDDGFYGDGEAGIAFDYAAPAGIGMLQDISRLIIGKDPMRTDELWERMFKISFWGQGGGPVVFAAISAIDIALMDIKGKVLNVPIYELLGGKVNDSIRCYASQLQFGWNEDVGPRGTAKEYADICKYAMSEGYDAVKLDFTMYDRDKKDIPNRDCEGFISNDFYKMVEERIAAIREECGDVDIIMENHSYPDALGAVQLAKLAEKYHIMAFEEPNTPTTQTVEYIAKYSSVPIANGERLYSRWQYAEYFKKNLLQLAQPDIGNCGGITEVKKISDMAHAYDVGIQMHCMAGPIACAATVQVEATISNFVYHECLQWNTLPVFTTIGKHDDMLIPVNGSYNIPDRPGIGQELSEEAIAGAEHILVK